MSAAPFTTLPPSDTTCRAASSTFGVLIYVVQLGGTPMARALSGSAIKPAMDRPPAMNRV
ncbi:MAG: hypothetical protein DMF89_05455 [Acidobacteria bacterium]|nr:MAG: hypothetical protein DMF89_05455 [Acidobacteriota bacterium]